MDKLKQVIQAIGVGSVSSAEVRRDTFHKVQTASVTWLS